MNDEIKDARGSLGSCVLLTVVSGKKRKDTFVFAMVGDADNTDWLDIILSATQRPTLKTTEEMQTELAKLSELHLPRTGSNAIAAQLCDSPIATTN